MLVPAFELVDHDGRNVTLTTYRGRFQLIFFGFTHCKVVCPRALARLSEVLARLGSAAQAIQPLYISVDPERDTPAVMKAFLAAYPAFTGLTGTRPQVEAAKAAFRVFAQARPDPDEPEGYVVPHTALTYLLDRKGAYLAHFADHLDAETVVTRLLAMLCEGEEHDAND